MIRSLRHILLFVFVSLLWACADEISLSPYVEKDVSLSLSAAPVDRTKPSGKSVSEEVDEGLESGYVIADFWIFQYNNRGLLVGNPSYYRTNGQYTRSVPVLLPLESGVENAYTTVFIANTHDNSLTARIDHATLDDLMAANEIVSCSADLYREGFGDMLMSGSVILTSETESVECELYRNVAKVNVNISNSAASGITITSVQFKNVNSTLCYADHLYHATPGIPNTSSVTFVDFEKDDISVQPGQNSSLKYYLTRNMRGSGSSSTEYDKNTSAPIYSTYIEVMAVHNDRNTPIRYRFYVGKNNKDNYDVEPNYLYNIDLHFNSMGAAEDNRVEDLSEVVLGDANSYIIQPIKDVGIKYTIPIKSRINTFWESTEGKVSDDWSRYIIDGNNEWVAEVIWQDVDAQVVKFCMEDGTLTDTYSGGAGDFFSIVPTDAAVGRPCNVVIGVRSAKDGWNVFNDGYMWSWHIWLTDYDPDSDVGGWSDGKYSYQVPGGAVHKYASFEGESMYEGKFIMDRNLGSTSYRFTPYMGITQKDVKAAVGMYYEYGRKDPFPGVKIYDINGNLKSFSDGSNKVDSYGISIQPGPAAIYASVIKPYNYYWRNGDVGGNDWVVENSLVSYDWNDLNKIAKGGKVKSFFDPCPPGWKLPDESIFDSMGHNNAVYASNCVSWTDFTLNKSQYDGYRGWVVYLSGEDGWNSKSGDVAYFPTSNNRAHSSGTVGDNLGGNGGLWTVNPLSNGNAYYLYYENKEALLFSHPRGYYRYIGLPVRCIQE